MSEDNMVRGTDNVLEVQVRGTDRLDAEKRARYLGEMFYGVPGSQLECLMVRAEARYEYDYLIGEAELRMTNIGFVCGFRLSTKED